MGVMMAPVAGSGSWPAWMQSVGKRASGVSFTPPIVSGAQPAGGAADAPSVGETAAARSRGCRGGRESPPHKLISCGRPRDSSVIHVLPTRSAADGSGVAAAGAAAPVPAGPGDCAGAGGPRLQTAAAAPVAGPRAVRRPCRAAARPDRGVELGREPSQPADRGLGQPGHHRRQRRRAGVAVPAGPRPAAVAGSRAPDRLLPLHRGGAVAAHRRLLPLRHRAARRQHQRLPVPDQRLRRADRSAGDRPGRGGRTGADRRHAGAGRARSLRGARAGAFPRPVARRGPAPGRRRPSGDDRTGPGRARDVARARRHVGARPAAGADSGVARARRIPRSPQPRRRRRAHRARGPGDRAQPVAGLERRRRRAARRSRVERHRGDERHPDGGADVGLGAADHPRRPVERGGGAKDDSLHLDPQRRQVGHRAVRLHPRPGLGHRGEGRRHGADSRRARRDLPPAVRARRAALPARAWPRSRR